MEPVSPAVYNRIDNQFYDAPATSWWEPDSVLYLLKTSVNPLRVGFAQKKIREVPGLDPRGRSALEVGCGGGILCEEIARMGFRTTGIDPSGHSLEVARQHARQSGLEIDYRPGNGEAIPFPDGSFEAVFCCDVLEHVRDLPRVIAEITRVLKPGGIFIFDTFNRTLLSKLVAIKLWQEWKRWAFFPPNTHVWEMFIRPAELREVLQASGLEFRAFTGSRPSVSLPRMLGYLRKRARGKWTYKELGEQFQLVEDKDMQVLYLGWAVKPA
ncbi:MAG TPA: bifunctional 2-polyprenyl-6-hydroxyphenol methylase/3-demethylubiquinol 3-O-methyltransferase UbiG [Chitinophagaceae bacterium]|nr:bifunctional 2-polyprenyl-6-hydroxyphenol methylase/3-demethylubiquinol 3-O-methyltransferase UbiG [Chitinophagaceae bacterium]